MSQIVVIQLGELLQLVQGVVRSELSRAQTGELVSAKVSGLSTRTFRRLVREGVLDGKKVGRQYLVRRESLDLYLAQRDAPKPPPSPSADPIQALLDAGRLRVVSAK